MCWIWSYPPTNVPFLRRISNYNYHGFLPSSPSPPWLFAFAPTLIKQICSLITRFLSIHIHTYNAPYIFASNQLHLHYFFPLATHPCSKPFLVTDLGFLTRSRSWSRFDLWVDGIYYEKLRSTRMVMIPRTISIPLKTVFLSHSSAFSNQGEKLGINAHQENDNRLQPLSMTRIHTLLQQL